MSDSWMAAVETNRLRVTGQKLEDLAKALYVEVDEISYLEPAASA